MVHAEYPHLFGRSPEASGRTTARSGPSASDIWRSSPFAGVVYGLRYEIDRSPEGLSSFLGRVAGGRGRGPGRRDAPAGALPLGRGHGDHGTPAPGRPGRRAGSSGLAGLGAPVLVYRLPPAAPAVLLAGATLPVPHLNAARKLFLAPGFDPERHRDPARRRGRAVGDPPRRTGAGGPGAGRGGAGRVLAQGPERARGGGGQRRCPACWSSSAPSCRSGGRGRRRAGRGRAGEPLPHRRPRPRRQPPAAALGRPAAALAVSAVAGLGAGRAGRPLSAGRRAAERPAGAIAADGRAALIRFRLS